MTKEAKPDAWMPLYIGDWEGDTGHLNCEEDGAYGRLVRHYWRNGPLPDDDRRLAGIIRCDARLWRRLRPVLALFFTVADGIWRHKRIDEELVRWSAKKERAVERARAGGRAKAAKSSATSTPQAVLKQCSSPSKVERGTSSLSTLTTSASADERAVGSSAHRSWLGPEDFREAVVSRYGEAFARSWLDQTAWQDVPERAIVCRLGITAKRLNADLRRLLSEHDIKVRTEVAA